MPGKPESDEPANAITFQLYRINMQGKTLQELQGVRLAEHSMPGHLVKGTDTVATIKSRVMLMFQEHMRADDRVTFFFAGRRMQDDAFFYADHFMLLPVWVQIVLHDCDVEELEAAIRRLAAPS